MTNEQYDSIIQILRSMNERLGKIERTAGPERPSKPLITKRLITLIVFSTLVTIGVYLGFTALLGNLMSFLPVS